MGRPDLLQSPPGEERENQRQVAASKVGSGGQCAQEFSGEVSLTPRFIGVCRAPTAPNRFCGFSCCGETAKAVASSWPLQHPDESR